METVHIHTKKKMIVLNFLSKFSKAKVLTSKSDCNRRNRFFSFHKLPPVLNHSHLVVYTHIYFCALMIFKKLLLFEIYLNKFCTNNISSCISLLKVDFLTLSTRLSLLL